MSRSPQRFTKTRPAEPWQDRQDRAEQLWAIIRKRRPDLSLFARCGELRISPPPEQGSSPLVTITTAKLRSGSEWLLIGTLTASRFSRALALLHRGAADPDLCRVASVEQLPPCLDCKHMAEAILPRLTAHFGEPPPKARKREPRNRTKRLPTIPEPIAIAMSADDPPDPPTTE